VLVRRAARVDVRSYTPAERGRERRPVVRPERSGERRPVVRPERGAFERGPVGRPERGALGQPGRLARRVGRRHRTVLELTASGIAFDKADLTAPAGVPFQIKFTNNDAGIPHNVAIHKDSPAGEVVWQGEIFSGTDTRTYDVPALPAGTYGFSCTVRPNMTGTLTVK